MHAHACHTTCHTMGLSGIPPPPAACTPLLYCKDQFGEAAGAAQAPQRQRRHHSTPFVLCEGL